MDYRELARAIAVEEGVDPDLFLRLVNAESAFNPQARSPVGAIGLAQLMPGTAQELGVDPMDPVQNLRGGARYFRQQLDAFGDPTLALAAYNAGPGNVRKYGGIPPFRETQNYVSKIMGAAANGAPVTPPSSPAGPRLQNGYQPPAMPQQPEQQQPQADFARGYQPISELAGMYAQQQPMIDPLSLYDPYAIAQRFGVS